MICISVKTKVRISLQNFLPFLLVLVATEAMKRKIFYKDNIKNVK